MGGSREGWLGGGGGITFGNSHKLVHLLIMFYPLLRLFSRPDANLACAVEQAAEISCVSLEVLSLLPVFALVGFNGEAKARCARTLRTGSS